MEDDVPLSEAYRVTAKSWVDAEAAASLLEETKSAVLARMMLAQGDMPVSRAEMNVKASDEWREFIQKMVEAREKAAFLKVKMEYIRMKASERQSMEATKRAEMKL